MKRKQVLGHSISWWASALTRQVRVVSEFQGLHNDDLLIYNFEVLLQP